MESTVFLGVVPVLPSANIDRDLDWYYKKAGTLRLQKIIPAGFYKTATLLNHFMGSTMKEEKVMVLSFVRKTDSAFIQWAVNAILQWKYSERFNNLIHIHGNRDRLLPVKYTSADYVIRGGRHLMVWNKAAEINIILQEVLRETDQPSNN